VYAAQPLANRQIAVLQVEDKSIDGVTGTPREPVMYMHAYEAAIAHFDELGVVDSTRVGLVGFSRTVWHVEYALAHSAAAYVAAVVDDGWDGNYVQSTSVSRQEFQRDLGAAPFAEGLNTWLREAPAFNLERVHAALRMQVSSGGLPGVLQMWEMYSRLTQLKRPVELFLLPDLEHGSHGIQNPRQCLEAKEGAVDWFDYWLNGNKSNDAARAKQYDRWDSMRDNVSSAVTH
jgi:hypothetical protein